MYPPAMCIDMVETTHLADELRQHDSVVRVEESSDVVSFDVQRGEYNSLASEVISTIGRYDCEMYIYPEEEYKYRLV